MVFFSVRDVAKMLNLSYERTLEFVKYSGIAYIKIGRQYRIKDSVLHSFLTEMQSKGDKPP